MEKKEKEYLKKFEVLSETKTGSLINGFSTAISLQGNALSVHGGRVPDSVNSGCSNNCQGGNCAAGCGG